MALTSTFQGPVGSQTSPHPLSHLGTLGGARHVRWAGIQEDYLGRSPAPDSNHFLPPGNADDSPQGLEKEPRGLSGRWYIESGD